MFIHVDQVLYHIEVTGEGPPLVLLHGFTGNLHQWDPFLNQWQKYFKVIRLDIIGHGKTQALDDVRLYEMDQVASQLNQVLESLSLHQIYLLGYSMGGRLALTFADLFPKKVKALILESTSPGLEAEEERLERIKKDEGLVNFILSDGIEAFVDYWERIPLFESQKHLPSDVQLKQRNQRLKNDPIGLANSLRGMGTGAQRSLWDKLSHMLFPTLLIVGSRDVKFRQIADKMKKQLPEATLKTIENAGHSVHLEQPEEFDIMVRDFILKGKD